MARKTHMYLHVCTIARVDGALPICMYIQALLCIHGHRTCNELCAKPAPMPEGEVALLPTDIHTSLTLGCLLCLSMNLCHVSDSVSCV